MLAEGGVPPLLPAIVRRGGIRGSIDLVARKRTNPQPDLISALAPSGLGGATVVQDNVFVVVGAVAEAALEDVDESVSDGAERLVVQVPGVTSLIVELSGTRTVRRGP